MVTYWSFPFKDEILYSLIGRNLSYFNHKYIKPELELYFGSPNISATLDLPSGISFLSSQIRDLGITAETLINNHTLFPYYRHFLSKEKQESIIKSMLFKSGDIHTSIGINAGIHPPLKNPRFCISCFKENISKEQPVYFRRVHQLPSVKICVRHNFYLVSANQVSSVINKHVYIIPQIALLELENAFNRRNNNTQILKISEQLVSLLEDNQELTFDGSAYFYNNKIRELGFQKGKSSLDLESIYDAWRNFYDSETLIHFSSNVKAEDDSCWLKAIFRKHRKAFDPCRHILVQYFLKSIENQTRSSEQLECTPNPICRNPVCDHYQTDKQISVSNKYDAKTKRIIASVSCKCEYVYTQSYIRSKGRYFIRVKDHGKLWMHRLKELSKQGLSKRKIGSILNADSKTINRLLVFEKTESDSSIFNNLKNEWNKLKEENPGKSITELRAMNTGLYMKLYRNFKEWLLKQHYAQRTNNPSLRIDWIERDRDLVSKCKVALDKIKQTLPAKRISKTLLLNLIGKESLYRHNTKKLPLLADFLNKASETKHQHRLRRLAIAANELFREGQSIAYWDLLRKANIRKEYISQSIHQLALHYTGEEQDFRYKKDQTA